MSCKRYFSALLVLAGMGLLTPYQVLIADSATDYPVSVPGLIYALDVDNDIDRDLIVFSEANRIAVLLNDGNATFINIGTSTSGPVLSAMDWADFDDDGNLDLAFACWETDYVTVRMGNGDGTFQSPVYYELEGDMSRPAGICAADLDGDGYEDLAVSETYHTIVRLMFNNGDGTFTIGPFYDITGPGYEVVAADLDGDTDNDLAVATGSYLSILLNNGDGTFAPRVEYPTGLGNSDIVAADLDGDTDIDLAVTEDNFESVFIHLNNGDGSFQAGVKYIVGNRPKDLDAADLDGDGDIDLVTANTSDNFISLRYNDGSGGFVSAKDYRVGLCYGVTAADLDGDLDNDLVITLDNSVEVLFNDGAAGIIYLCGDVNLDGQVNVGDAVYSIGVIFKGQPGPPSTEAADANGDGTYNVGDPVYIIGYVFKGAPAPLCPAAK